MRFADNSFPDQPGHLHKLIWAFVVCLQNQWISTDSVVYANGQKMASITKTSLYNFDPLKPQFYIVKLGFTGVPGIYYFSYFCSKT